MDDALGNWLWLVNLPSRRDALVLVSGSDAERCPLTRAFEREHVVRVVADGPVALNGATVDCVAVPDAAVLFVAAQGALPLLKSARLLLQPHHGYYVGIESVHDSERARTPAAIVRAWRRAQAPLLRKAGFRDVRTYFVVQSPLAPRHLVPDNTDALIAWDRAVSPPGWRASMRQLLYRLRLASLVLRYRLVVGQA